MQARQKVENFKINMSAIEAYVNQRAENGRLNLSDHDLGFVLDKLTADGAVSVSSVLQAIDKAQKKAATHDPSQSARE